MDMALMEHQQKRSLPAQDTPKNQRGSFFLTTCFFLFK